MKTKCWTCKNALCGCSWSMHQIPVKGWVAEQTWLKDEQITSYTVKRCPKYEFDKMQVSARQISKLLNVTEHFVYRATLAELCKLLQAIKPMLTLVQLSDGTYVIKRKEGNAK